MTELDTIKIAFPSDESATWISVADLDMLIENGKVKVNAKTLVPEDGPFRIIIDGDIVERGGPGSGHRGHAGRPGEVGGSLPSGATAGDDIKQRPRTTRWLERNVRFDFTGCKGGEGENCEELDAIKDAMIKFEEVLGYRIEDLTIADNPLAAIKLLFPDRDAPQQLDLLSQLIGKMDSTVMAFLKGKTNGEALLLINPKVLRRNSDTINLTSESENWFFVAYHELGHYLQKETGVESLPVKAWQGFIKTDVYNIYSGLGYPHQRIDDEFRSDFLAAYIQADGDFDNLRLSDQRFPDYEIEGFALDLFQRSYPAPKAGASLTSGTGLTGPTTGSPALLTHSPPALFL